jgi:hypothetical protein
MVRYRAISGLLILLIVSSVTACSILPWKKERSPYTKGEVAKLSDKDIYIIDGEKYLKVPLGKDEQGDVQFHYVKVDRYLAGEVEPLPLEMERVTTEETHGVGQATQQEAGVVASQETVVQEQEVQEPPPITTRTIKHPYLKRKIAILPFEDRTQFTLEKFGEVIADRLAKKMEEEVFTSQVMDREMVRLALARVGLKTQDITNPSKTTVLNKALGVQGVIVGTVYGPFVTTTNPVEYEKISMAIVRIVVKFIDSSQGQIVKEFVVTNPLGGSEEFGVLSEERAKYRAVDLAIERILAQVVSEIQGMDWLTRIALVEGNTVYLNAGNRTGLKAGDLLEVYSAGDVNGEKPIGRIKVSKLFGVDAAVARIIRGRVQVNAVVKPLPQS